MFGRLYGNQRVGEFERGGVGGAAAGFGDESFGEEREFLASQSEYPARIEWNHSAGIRAERLVEKEGSVVLL